MKMPKISMPAIFKSGFEKVRSVVGKKTIIAAVFTAVLGAIFAFRNSAPLSKIFSAFKKTPGG